MVFDKLIRKGDLGGFGLENLGNIGQLNGRVNLPQDFNPTELQPRPQPTVQDVEEDVEQEQEPQQTPPQQQTEQLNFFGEGGTPPEQQTPDFFGKVAGNNSQKENNGENIFGKPEDNKVNVNFFGSKIPQKSRAKVRAGIANNNANIFGDNIKIKRNKPLIGSLKEGVDFFDRSFNSKSDKPPLKRGTGFDNFVGDIDINALSRGKPDSAVPKTGIFSKQGRKGKGISQPVDLSQMNQNLGVLPNPKGFEDFNVEQSVESFNETPAPEFTGKKAGRPKGSVGKKKRQARKIQKKKKKKKINELTRSRISVLKEQERLKKGGVPRNSFQGESFKAGGVSPNTQDNSFRSFFT